ARRRAGGRWPGDGRPALRARPRRPRVAHPYRTRLSAVGNTGGTWSMAVGRRRGRRPACARRRRRARALPAPRRARVARLGKLAPPRAFPAPPAAGRRRVPRQRYGFPGPAAALLALASRRQLHSLADELRTLLGVARHVRRGRAPARCARPAIDDHVAVVLRADPWRVGRHGVAPRAGGWSGRVTAQVG